MPGLGVFFLTSYPSRIDLKAHQIYPPGWAVEFLDAPNISDYYLAYILSESHRGDFSYWNTEIDQFVSEFQHLEKGSSLALGKIGEFRMRESLIFVQGANGGDLLFNPLPALDCKPVAIYFGAEEEVVPPDLPKSKDSVSPQTKTASPGKSQFNWKIILWIGAAVLFLLSLLFFDTCNREEEKVEIPFHVSHDRLNKPPDKLYVDSFQQEGEENSDRPENEGDADVGDIEETPEVESDLSSPPEQEEDNMYEEMEPAENEENTENLIADPCVIITGSFSQNRNINSMKTQLENMGYTLYEEPIGSLTRVGVVIDCSEDNLENHLSLLREKVEERSWVMD